MDDAHTRAAFDTAVLPHLDAAYNLARWLVRDDHDAEDVVQEATLKALRFFGGFRGGDPRAWLLAIVRNASYTWLGKKLPDDLRVSLEEDGSIPADSADTPEAAALNRASGRSLEQALGELPVALREAIVLRELEGLSYGEIALVADVPIGTVMSRLSRARLRLRRALAEHGPGKEVSR